MNLYNISTFGLMDLIDVRVYEIPLLIWVHVWTLILEILTGFEMMNYRVFRKKCIFSRFTATPPSPTCSKRPSKLAMRVYSHSYWLVIFCTTNCSRVLARESWQTFANFKKKTQYLMNTLYYIYRWNWFFLLSI